MGTTKVAQEHASTRVRYHGDMGTRAMWPLGTHKHQGHVNSKAAQTPWPHGYQSDTVPGITQALGTRKLRGHRGGTAIRATGARQGPGLGCLIHPRAGPCPTVPHPHPCPPLSLSPRWAWGGSQQPNAWIPTGQRAARGERARVRGHVCGRRGHVRWRGGGAGGGWGEPVGRWSLTDEEVALALPAVPQPVDKRVPDLSLGTQSREGERPPGVGGGPGGAGDPAPATLPSQLWRPPAIPTATLTPPPMGWGPPWTPQPNLDADFFLALLEGVAAQHLHFGDDLWGGMRGRGRGGGARAGGSTHGPQGQHPPSRRRPSPARSPAL